MAISSHGVSLTVWMIVFTVIVTVVLALRFWAVTIMRRSLRADDYLILVAYASMLSFHGVTWWSIANGLGSHTQTLSQSELLVQFKIVLATGLTWLPSTVFAKLSILWMYTTIFSVRPFKIASWTLMGVVGAYGISFFVVFLTNCSPINYRWNPVPGGHCKDVTSEEITSVSLNMVIDLAIVILPMPLLWGLKMPLRKKIAISVLFSLGFVVIAVMIWRLVLTVQDSNQLDFVYGLGNVALAALLEVWLGITVACIPTLAPLFAKYLKPIVTRMSKGSSGKRSAERQLREASHTIGSSGGFKKHKNTFVELESGINMGTVDLDADQRSPSPNGTDDDRALINEPNSINVQRVVQVYSQPSQDMSPGEQNPAHVPMAL